MCIEASGWGVAGAGRTEDMRKDSALIVTENHWPWLWHTWVGRKLKPFVLWGRISEGSVENCPLFQLRKNSCSPFFNCCCWYCSWSLGSNYEAGPVPPAALCVQGSRSLRAESGVGSPWVQWTLKERVTEQSGTDRLSVGSRCSNNTVARLLPRRGEGHYILHPHCKLLSILTADHPASVPWLAPYN